MPVTVVEAALAGAAFTALGSTVTGLVIQRSTGNRDHLVRLWERQAEVYESVLAGVSDETVIRADVMKVVEDKTGTKSKLAGLDGSKVADVLTDSTLLARVVLFGSGKVVNVLNEYDWKNRRWERALDELKALDIGQDQAFTDEMLVEIREAYKIVYPAEAALLEIIRDEIRSTPGARRRWGVLLAERLRNWP